MAHCCVPHCLSDTRTKTDENSKLSFHTFPKDGNLKKAWVIAIRRDEGPDFKVTRNSYVCSRHFRSTDYSWIPGGSRRKLNKGTVPSRFEWRSTPKRKAPKCRVSLESSSCRYEEPLASPLPEDGPGVSSATNSILTEDTDKTIKKLQEKLEETAKQLERKTTECEQLNEKLTIERFCIKRFSDNDKMIQFYTGFPSYAMFIAFYNFIEPSAKTMLAAYYTPLKTGVTSKSGRPRNMLLIDELFMFLCRIHSGLKELDLSDRFNIHVSSISCKLVTWTKFLYFVLGSIPIWPSREMVNANMPLSFKRVYPGTRVILDCTEIKTQMPSSMLLGSQMYSNYKSHTTYKGLVGISPNGAITFVSKLYTGSISDVDITRRSGFIDLLEQGDGVMADKGFTIAKMVAEKGAKLNIPPFLRNSSGPGPGRFTEEEIADTQQIASVRIHVERAIRRIKENHIFDCILPLTLAGSVNQLWAVSCVLCNFKGPLIVETDSNNSSTNDNET